MKLTYHSAAEAEVLAAARVCYHAIKGLAARFLDEFDFSIAMILEAPERWRIIKGDKRRYLMRRFPYGIYYRIVGDKVHILVVQHHCQHPEHGWRRMRLKVDVFPA